MEFIISFYSSIFRYWVTMPMQIEDDLYWEEIVKDHIADAFWITIASVFLALATWILWTQVLMKMNCYPQVFAVRRRWLLWLACSILWFIVIICGDACYRYSIAVNVSSSAFLELFIWSILFSILSLFIPVLWILSFVFSWGKVKYAPWLKP